MTDQKLVEGEDFIIERGFYVFTREFLLRRGYCCEAGCRNCPFGRNNQKKVPG